MLIINVAIIAKQIADQIQDLKIIKKANNCTQKEDNDLYYLLFYSL